ncbi:MAG: TIR domain-containing protein, partial [Desulfobacterales bacterium]
MVDEKKQFDIFISYSTDPDYSLAREIKLFLETFHELPTPENIELRPIKVCMDGSDFRRSVPSSTGVMASEIEPVVEHYLRRTARLLVLCSAQACTSRWVNQEIQWFLERDRIDDIFLALSEGSDPGLHPFGVIPASLIDR